jgi:hypothetical protein
MGIHLFHCTRGGERTTSHDAIRNAFVSIVRDARFHILQEQTHILQPPSFQNFHQRVNIVWSIDSICTLDDVVIVDPILTNLVSHVAFFHGVVMIVVAQMKEKLYHDCYPMDMFFPIIIEVGCFHEQSNNFFGQWVNMVWTAKGIEGPPLSIVALFF